AVIVFYPNDFAVDGGAQAAELRAFSDRAAEFAALGAEVCAVSVDSGVHVVLDPLPRMNDPSCSIRAWIERPPRIGGLGSLAIPLVSDITHRIAQAFGVFVPALGVAHRATFLIDPSMTVRHAVVRTPFPDAVTVSSVASVATAAGATTDATRRTTMTTPSASAAEVLSLLAAAAAAAAAASVPRSPPPRVEPPAKRRRVGFGPERPSSSGVADKPAAVVAAAEVVPDRRSVKPPESGGEVVRLQKKEEKEKGEWAAERPPSPRWREA
ncbi:hypothetical protein HK405_007364, partial [Cladochytrium tenue]